MKKVALIFVLALIIQIVGYSQPCLPEGITFSTQEEIDNFQINYPNCTEIEGQVTIDGSDITNLEGLGVLTTIGGDLRIWSFLGSLTSLTGLENLTSIGGYLEISDNTQLTSLTGLDGLTSIGGSLYIGYWEFDAGNPSLTSIEALSNLTSIGGILEIANNPSLTSLVGLDNIDADSITELYIYNNLSLPSCDIQSVCDYLASPNGSINIYNNASGCNYPVEVMNDCGITFSCLPFGNYYFISQSDIDDFQTNYPGCIQLKGNVRISGGNSITNLNGLSAIDSIEGSLYILGNYILTYLSGLDGLTCIGEDLVVGQYGEQYWNHSLTSLTGLESLNSIGGSLVIDRDPSLVSVSGLEGLTSIGQSFWLGYTPSLTSISALSNLTYVGDNLMIASMYPENYSLTSLTGLENLALIGGYIRIWGMDSLTNLLALENLNTIEGVLEIVGNDALTNLTGLANIDAASINDLIIRNNSSLSVCEVLSVCEYIAAPNGTITIYDNASGCNSQEEVEEACEALGLQDIILNNDILLYPNPATNKLFITSKNGLKIETVNIYNQIGQKVLHGNKIKDNIDISTLGQGIYIIEMTSSELKIRQKLIIE